jgi:hypothetical protein
LAPKDATTDSWKVGLGNLEKMHTKACAKVVTFLASKEEKNIHHVE